VTWSSGDNKIATIDENTGELSCIDVGTTPIYVIFNGRAIGYVNLKCAQPVSNITLDNAEIELECGTYVEQEKKSKKLTATVFPENATHKEVVWSSSDVKVARVNASDGTITAVGPGTATITCKSKYGENYSEVTATCTVNVKQRVNTVALSTSKLSLFTDETVKLTPNVAPETAENKAVTWLSDDESIVTVDGEGNVHAVATGTAHITCTSVDSPEAKAVCTVTVQPNASDITLNYTSCELIMGSSNYDDRMITLDATITSDTTDVEYKKTWTSSNTGIAKVSNTGVVTAVAPGEAIITCSINSTKYATCRITVKQLVTSINVVKEPNVSTLNVGETMVVTANILPANATNKAVVWESSDPEVVTVSQTGNINAVGKGVATITCSAQDGSERYRSFSITVKQQVETLSIDQKEISLYVGKTQQIIATVSPENADNKSLTWTSSDTSVATVSSSGLVRGCGRGTATITCTTRDGSNISESCNVTVTQQINKIVLNNTSATVVVGKTLALTATIEPDNANVKAVVWKSDNEKVAKVSNTGVVTAVSKGTANITCSATDGVGAKAICRITVQQPVKSIKLDATSKTLFVGKTGKLTATVAPLDASNRNLTWTSSNTNIVTVSNGTITAKAKGTATVTCAANDGSGVKATCKVTVTTPVTSIKLNATKKTLNAGKTMTLKATVAPTNAGNKNVTWTSSNTKVAKVSSTGVVKAVGRGTATITCTAKDGSGVKTTCVVTVVQKVTKITLNKTKLSLKRGNKYTLKATVKPTNADNRAVQWKTSNKNIATVSSNGVVTAKKKGTVTITCTAKDGSKKYAKCKITIK
ncbi:MAG: Ig-like domain-containing protein, partial [Coprococcus sp.]